MAITNVGSTGGMQPVAVVPQVGTGAAAAPVPKASPAAQPSPEQIQKAVETIKTKVDSMASNSLQFSVDDQTGKTIIRVVDSMSGTTIRQIPSQEIIELAHSLDQMQKGLLLKQKA